MQISFGDNNETTEGLLVPRPLAPGHGGPTSKQEALLEGWLAWVGSARSIASDADFVNITLMKCIWQ